MGKSATPARCGSDPIGSHPSANYRFDSVTRSRGSLPQSAFLNVAISKTVRAIAAAILTILCVACGGSVHPSVSYSPPLLPIEISVSPSSISIHGDASIYTPMGVFSIGATYSLPALEGGSIYVIIRDQAHGFDHIYKVIDGTDKLTAVVNGKTRISVTNGQVLIDVLAGQVETIKFEKTIASITVASPTKPIATWRVVLVTFSAIALVWMIGSSIASSLDK
jgi:hypothetical protein